MYTIYNLVTFKQMKTACEKDSLLFLYYSNF